LQENPGLKLLPPPKKTNSWKLKITQLKRKIILQTFVIVFHVKFPGCTPFKLLHMIGVPLTACGISMIGSMVVLHLSWHVRESMHIVVDEEKTHSL